MWTGHRGRGRWRGLAASAALGLFVGTLASSCSQTTTKADGPENSSLEATMTWLVARVNEGSTIHVSMGDKLITHSAAVTRKDACVLGIRDRQHIEVGSSWQEWNTLATVDFRGLSSTVGTRPFEGSGLQGAIVTVASTKQRGAIQQDVDQTSSAVGPIHSAGPTETFEFTLADHDLGDRVATALRRAIDLCTGVATG